MPALVTFIGWHDCGKTTLLSQIIPLLKKRGYAVAVVKSTKERDLLQDEDGADTAIHRQAGADAVALAAPDRLLITVDEQDKDLAAIAQRFFADMDIVLGEGFKEAVKVPKIEVHRSGPFLREQVQGVIAVASDQLLPTETVFALHETDRLADFIEQQIFGQNGATDHSKEYKTMLLNQSFTITQPTRVRFGVGMVKELGAVVKECQGSKVLLVIDLGLVKAGLLARFTAPLEQEKIPCVVYDQIDPEPGLRLADQACALAKENNCDCVIGAGGGSAMDVAKAAAILLTNGGKAADYLGLGLINKPGLPKIMVPTSAGTGAEVTFTAVFINEETGSKGGMNGDPLYPDAAVLDPELTLSLPPKVTAYTGIDALTHALEAYTSVQAHAISEMYSLEAVRLIAETLPAACANGGNLEARTAMLLGSLLGGKALALAGVGLVHAMAYPLGGMFGIPHGLANAVLLPYVVQYNLPGNLRKFAQLAEALGQNTTDLPLREAAQLCVDALFDLNADAGIPATLADLDIPAEKIPEMAKIALTVARPVANNPRKPTVEEVISLYKQAYNPTL